jgi:hypothetical protein
MINKFTLKIKNLQFTYSTVPAALLILGILSFGLLLPRLGYYWDDWERILIVKLYNPAVFWDYFNTKRPFAAWVYNILSPLLGGQPIGWHIVSLLFRCLCSISFWWVLCTLWPANKRQATLTAFLFLVFPIFMQQAIIVYFKHWLAYTFYFVSIGLNLLAIRNPRRYSFYTLTAVIAELLHLSLIEYFTGLEVLRPLVIFIFSINQNITFSKGLLQAIKHWIPYLIVLMVFSGWRLAFGASLADNPYSPELATNLVKYPLDTLRNLANLVLQDMIFVLVSTWSKTVKTGVINLSIPFTLLAWFVGFLAAILVSFYLIKLSYKKEEQLQANSRWITQAMSVGISAAFLGLAPIWITYRAASTEGLFIDRFAMAAMAGASLFTIAFLEWLVQDYKKKAILLSLLVMAAVSLHVRTDNDYRWSWVRQQRIYWQLYWRAPYIKPQTLILTDNILFLFVSPQFAINLFYREPVNPRQGAYIFEYLGSDFGRQTDEWLKGKEIVQDYTIFSTKASTLDSLVIYREEKTGNCLWVLQEKDKDNPYLPDIVRAALPISNMNRIEAQPKAGYTPAEDVFGKEPEHTWCYYYEKGDLAYQSGDYTTVASLGDDAISHGFLPTDSQANSPQEWLNFIESYARIGKWQNASDITESSFKVDHNYKQVLCDLWQNIDHQTQQNNEKAKTIGNIYNLLGCIP